MTAATESPLARLSEQELEKLAKELDAIHDEVFAELGDGRWESGHRGGFQIFGAAAEDHNA